MQAEWSAECSPDDPVLVVPWHDPSGAAHFIDLREDPYALDQIPEAELHPPLMQALRALNAPRSPVFTAKCDAWPMPPDELESLQLNLDLAPAEAPQGFASYIDLLARDRTLFISSHAQQQRLHRFIRLLDPLDHPYAAAECILRPTFLDIPTPAPTPAPTPDTVRSPAVLSHEGFAFTLYVKALGTDAAHAYQHWSEALAAVTAILRSKDFNLA